jgi:RimJ/RimL family protein N-acetyltransferase
MLRGTVAYLSPLADADSPTLFSWINDRELVLASAPYEPTHLADHAEWFRTIRHRPDVVIFGIRRIADDCLVGSCQLHSISTVHRSAELQIRVGRADARGRGIGTDACALLLRHAFTDLNLHRVYLHVFETNERAIRLYTRTGFKQEGILRQSAFIDGRWLNTIVMSVLRDEYQQA